MGKINFPLPNPRNQIALTARGLISETFDIILASSNTAPVSQRVYANLLGLRAGDVVTNLLTAVSTAAVGTDPTGVWMGLYDSSGNRLGVTADLKANAAWDSTGVKAFALTSPVTISADGGYYVVILKDGAWAGTDVALARGSGANQDNTVSGGAKPQGVESTQTALDATITLTFTASIPYWFGVS